MKEDREAVEIHAASRPSRWFANCWRATRMLSGLEITSAGLEEAFLALTQENYEKRSHNPMESKQDQEGDAMSTATMALTTRQIQRSPRAHGDHLSEGSQVRIP